MTTTERILSRATGTLAIVALLAGASLIAPRGDGSGLRGHPVMAELTEPAGSIALLTGGFHPNG